MLRTLPLLLAVLAVAFFVAAPVVFAADETHEGVVVKAESSKVTMTDKDGKNEKTLDVAKTAKISCDGKECKLEDLKKGVKIKVTTTKEGDKTQVTKIEGSTK